jgi:hypothetical protein
MRWIAELQASEGATRQLMVEISPYLPQEAREIIARYPDYRDEHLQAALLALEKKHPWLAAKLDEHRGPKPPTPPTEPPNPRP